MVVNNIKLTEEDFSFLLKDTTVILRSMIEYESLRIFSSNLKPLYFDLTKYFEMLTTTPDQPKNISNNPLFNEIFTNTILVIEDSIGGVLEESLVTQLKIFIELSFKSIKILSSSCDTWINEVLSEMGIGLEIKN